MANGKASGANGAAAKRTSPVLWSAFLLGGIFYAWRHGLLDLSWVPSEFEDKASIALYVIIGWCVLQLLLAGARFRLRFRKALDAERPKESTHSARIATVRDIEEAELVDKPGLLGRWFRRADNTVRFYCGVVGRHVLELAATHMLILAPSGAGKNRCLIFILLGRMPQAMVVTDIKKESYEVTARFRKWWFGHRIILFGVGGVDSYNALDILKDDIAAGGSDVLTDARIIAQALIPEPKDERNAYWRQGGRDLIIMAMVGLCVKDPESANLGTVQMLVTDTDMFVAFCEEFEFDLALEGDLAGMARGLLAQFRNTPKTLQEYVGVAKQAMAPYARSGILHKLTKTSTFRYRDLKHKDAQGRGLTIYNNFDSSRRVVFEPFGAMLNTCMLLELQRDPSPERVVFINDEAANFVVKDLPKQMTIVRGDGNVHIVNVCQSRAQMRAAWGAEGEQIILDNSNLKVFFGVSTDEEARKISDLVGKQNVLTSSYAMGHEARDGVGESRAIGQREVLTPDMIRRSKLAVVIYKSERAMRVSLPGYERCEPMRSKFDINTRYGSKRFKGPKEVVF